jgi:hypothetical protein
MTTGSPENPAPGSPGTPTPPMDATPSRTVNTTSSGDRDAGWSTGAGADPGVPPSTLEACPVDHGPTSVHSGEEPRCVNKVRYFNKFVDEALAGLPPTAALLWFTLFRFARDGYATVSQKKLAAKMGVKVSTVKKNLGVLYACKLVKVTRPAIEGRRVNTYRLGIRELSARQKRKPEPPAR